MSAVHVGPTVHVYRCTALHVRVVATILVGEPRSFAQRACSVRHDAVPRERESAAPDFLRARCRGSARLLPALGARVLHARLGLQAPVVLVDPRSRGRVLRRVHDARGNSRVRDFEWVHGGRIVWASKNKMARITCARKRRRAGRG